MFRHHDEIELIGLRGGDDFLEVAGAVAAEKRMDVHHAFVLKQASHRLVTTIRWELSC